MKKNILLLSIFCTLQLLALKEPFNAETLGLSKEDLAHFVEVHGPEAVKQIAKYLPSTEKETEEQKLARIKKTTNALNGIFTKPFVNRFSSKLTKETSRILAAMRLCEKCETAGTVAKTTPLGDSFRSVRIAALEAEKDAVEQKVNAAMAEKRVLEELIKKNTNDLNRLKRTCNELKQQEEEQNLAKNPLVEALKRIEDALKNLSPDQRTFFLESAYYSRHFSSHESSFSSE